MQSDSNTFWVRGYLPNGFNVSFTMATTPESAYADALAFTNALLSQGFRVNEPGLEPGQKREAISQIVMGRKDDGTLYMDMYSTKFDLVNRMLSRVYFDADKPDLAETFQRHSGYALNRDHKFWIGENPITRGKKADTDAYLITLPHPVYAIAEQNPDYVEPPPGQMPKMAKWKVVHFEAITEPGQPAPAVAASTGNPYATKPERAWTPAYADKFVDMCKAIGVDPRAVLGVQSRNDFKGTIEEASRRLTAFTKEHAPDKYEALMELAAKVAA